MLVVAAGGGGGLGVVGFPVSCFDSSPAVEKCFPPGVVVLSGFFAAAFYGQCGLTVLAVRWPDGLCRRLPKTMPNFSSDNSTGATGFGSHFLVRLGIEPKHFEGLRDFARGQFSREGRAKV